ncbi:hypothetical protein Leryth_007659 [Lithospermum erythrorhizon]|nr:hypothetical protein Leryth_007659 [Lithospermum erythrorhizon]
MNSNETDHYALLAFKSALNDPQKALKSWNYSIHYCKWEGVACNNRHERVTMLALPSKGLDGKLTPFIGNLSSSSSVCQQFPCLAGRIPQEITYLKNLEQLDLCNNQITGEIPDSIGNLTSLTVFSVDSNLLSGNIPDSIGRLSNLSMLQLGNNTLFGTVPYSIYNLSSLTLFSIFSTQIHGTLDPDLGLMLPRLQTLNVAQTQLSGFIPHSLSNATHLEIIAMYNCSFTGKVKVDFSHLKNLQYLYLWGNSLGGEGPDSINFLNSLSNSRNLSLLDIQNNQFHGSLPSYMGNFSKKITSFSVSDNYLTGLIPPWITDIFSLSTLLLDHNQFSGSIPNDIGKLIHLQEFHLNNNRLSGQIPSSIGTLSLLNELDLSSNQLEGKVPNSLGNLQSLTVLDLSNNNFSESIPKEIFQISSLAVILNLSHNQFSGQFPPEVKNLGQLGTLDLSHNDISGEIPSSIESCTSLQFLNLSQNSFQGPIPKFLQTLRGLQHLDLSFNDFEGEVPQGGIFDNSNVISVSGNNRLCGGIHELNFPKCRKHKKSEYSLLVVILISCSAFVGLAAIFLILFCLKTRKKKNIPTESIEPASRNSLLKLSFAMLHKATEGFSSKNFLGKGSFGTVYKGFLDNVNQEIAVKVLHVQEQGVIRSFDAECNALSRLRHRNLVKILSACSSLDFQLQNFKALVYDFLPNGSLERWLHSYVDEKGEIVSKSLSLLERMNIAIDVAFAVDYLQNECPTLVVHCDIKPSNVLLDEDMVAHLGDFGLARIISDEDVQYQSSCRGLRGTIGYAAPEYGLGGEVSKKGDIYSLGILLLELITGKRPTDSIFEGDLNLNKFGKMGILENVMEIVDPNIVRIEEEQAKSSMENQVVDYEAIWKEKRHSIILMTKVAIACSMENPQDRSDIQTAINELQTARDLLLQV